MDEELFIFLGTMVIAVDGPPQIDERLIFTSWKNMNTYLPPQEQLPVVYSHRIDLYTGSLLKTDFLPVHLGLFSFFAGLTSLDCLFVVLYLE